MPLKSLGLLLLLVSVISCSGTRREQVSFLEFASSIPELPFPVKFGCDSGPEQVDYGRLDSHWLAQLAPTGRNYIVGRIRSNQDCVILAHRYIGDFNFPVLISYNSDGSIIDSLRITGDCFDAPDGSLLRYATLINADGSIVVEDTTRSSLSNATGTVIPSTERVSVKVHRFSISATGHFQIVQ